MSSLGTRRLGLGVYVGRRLGLSFLSVSEWLARSPLWLEFRAIRCVFWRVNLIVPGWERVCVPDMISTRPAMQLCVVFLFEQLFCYERRVPPLFLG